MPSVATRVAAELRRQIAEGTLPQRAKLKEEALSNELGVSRNTVREAFAELVSERLVVRQPNRGVVVASLGVKDIHGAVVALADSERLNTIMVQVLAEMRLFFHKAAVDGGFYQHWLADNEEICMALEAGDPVLVAERLADYLARSEEHQTAVHASGPEALK